MKRERIIKVTGQYSFILLWGITAALKLSGWEQTKSEMALQSFPQWLEHSLLWGLPALYIVLTVLLLYKSTVQLGVRLSTIVMTIFTLYLLFGVSGVLGYTPCACAGIWPTNNHWLHIVLNSLFIILGLIYWILAHRSHLGKDVISGFGRKEDTVLS
ncbi:MauE/DoxX family redox-associated membrane protein [Sphingobacterium multivorum]|uniref:MauE/DoxX family redox-associated membrane protein n=1 Tax=Sphingobacterium thalpophilum TaxID=259 RepID=A0ACD5BWU6_9SPHI|nr:MULTISPECIES: MauE/DoxX family redox-associated membrane protein [Sphingobacterium]